MSTSEWRNSEWVKLNANFPKRYFVTECMVLDQVVKFDPPLLIQATDDLRKVIRAAFEKLETEKR